MVIFGARPIYELMLYSTYFEPTIILGITLVPARNNNRDLPVYQSVIMKFFC